MTTREEQMRAAIEDEITEAMVDGIDLACDYIAGTLRRTARDPRFSPPQADALNGAAAAIGEIRADLATQIRKEPS
jgi:hypothetical protein